jgi:hypothetical protein
LDLACNGIPLSITIPTLSTVTSQDNTCKGCGQANLDIVVFSAFFQRKMHLTWGFFRFKFFFFFFLAKCIWHTCMLILVTRKLFLHGFIFLGDILIDFLSF